MLELISPLKISVKASTTIKSTGVLVMSLSNLVKMFFGLFGLVSTSKINLILFRFCKSALFSLMSCFTGFFIEILVEAGSSSVLIKITLLFF